MSSARYPISIIDLTDDEVKSLTNVLSIVIPDPPPRKDGTLSSKDKEAVNKAISSVKSNIETLPPQLRSSKSLSMRMVLHSYVPAAAACKAHKSLNTFVVNNLYRHIVREVTDHVDLIHEQGPTPPNPQVAATLNNLKLIEGMWWVNYAGNKRAQPPSGAAAYQKDKCEACIVARILKKPQNLEDIRAMLLSRVRTAGKNRTPRLMRIIDAAVQRVGLGAETIKTGSQSKATALRDARLSAINKAEKHRCSAGCKKSCNIRIKYRKTIGFTDPEVESDGEFYQGGKDDPANIPHPRS